MEARAHLGVETQHQWSDRAIARTTSALMGIFSWITLAAHLLRQQGHETHRTAAWYAKPAPTCIDVIASVRRHLWLASEGFSMSAAEPDIQEVPANLYHRLVDSLAYSSRRFRRLLVHRPWRFTTKDLMYPMQIAAALTDDDVLG